MRSIFILGLLTVWATAANPRAVPFGNSLPVNCNPGDLFFKLNASDGQQLYACPRSNTWISQGVASSGSSNATSLQGLPISSNVPGIGQALLWNGSVLTYGAPTTVQGFTNQLQDFQVVLTSPTVLTVCPNCSVTQTANIAIGSTIYVMSAPITITISGSSSGNCYIYLNNSGVIAAGDNGLTLALSGTGVHVSSITAFPPQAIAIATWHATSGTWDSTGTDNRSFISTKMNSPGLGTAINSAAGIDTFSVDPSVVMTLVAVPSTSSSACNVNQWSQDATYLYLCVTANSWRRIAFSTF